MAESHVGTEDDTRVDHGKLPEKAGPRGVTIGAVSGQCDPEPEQPQRPPIHNTALDFDTLARVIEAYDGGPIQGTDLVCRPEVWVCGDRAVGIFDRDYGDRIVLDLSPSAQLLALWSLSDLHAAASWTKEGLLEWIDLNLHGVQGISAIIDDLSRGLGRGRAKHRLFVPCWRGRDWGVHVTVMLRRNEAGTFNLMCVGGELDSAAQQAAVIAFNEVRLELKKHGASDVPVYVGVP